MSDSFFEKLYFPSNRNEYRNSFTAAMQDDDGKRIIRHEGEHVEGSRVYEAYRHLHPERIGDDKG